MRSSPIYAGYLYEVAFFDRRQGARKKRVFHREARKKRPRHARSRSPPILQTTRPAWPWLFHPLPPPLNLSPKLTPRPNESFVSLSPPVQRLAPRLWKTLVHSCFVSGQ